MKITLLQRKRNQLAGYCKLVIYGVLDLSAATDIFKHYSKVEMEIRALRNNSVLLAHTFRFIDWLCVTIVGTLAKCVYS